MFSWHSRQPPSKSWWFGLGWSRCFWGKRDRWSWRSLAIRRQQSRWSWWRSKKWRVCSSSEWDLALAKHTVESTETGENEEEGSDHEGGNECISEIRQYLGSNARYEESIYQYVQEHNSHQQCYYHSYRYQRLQPIHRKEQHLYY